MIWSSTTIIPLYSLPTLTLRRGNGFHPPYSQWYIDHEIRGHTRYTTTSTTTPTSTVTTVNALDHTSIHSLPSTAFPRRPQQHVRPGNTLIDTPHYNDAHSDEAFLQRTVLTSPHDSEHQSPGTPPRDTPTHSNSTSTPLTNYSVRASPTLTPHDKTMTRLTD